jgi:hypothetical protein
LPHSGDGQSLVGSDDQVARSQRHLPGCIDQTLEGPSLQAIIQPKVTAWA